MIIVDDNRILWEMLREKDLSGKMDSIKDIIQKHPDFVLKPMEDKLFGFDGQTPLHIAVARRELELVDLLLKTVQVPDKRRRLFQLSATGKAFEGTAMSGQIPLSIAALTFNEEMVELLLKYGAEIDAENSYEDNVFHSLVSYATVGNENKVWAMIDFIIKLPGSLPSIIDAMWWKTNAAGYTPLLLAVKYAQSELFGKVLAINDVFSTTKLTDGMDDVVLVDITQIDTVAYENYQRHADQSSTKLIRPTKSVMTIITTLEGKAVENFADIPAIRKCVETKWKKYKYPYFLWAALHVIILVFLCLAAVKRAGGLTTLPSATSWVPLVFNLLYSLAKIAMVWFQIKTLIPPISLTELHNFTYMLLMTVSSVTSVVDHIWFFTTHPTSTESNIFLSLVIIIDFTFLPFFLRSFKRFSFFTVMLQRIIYRDIFRFMIFVILLLFSFSLAIYVVSGAARGDNGGRFVNITSDLSKLMLGLDDLSLDDPQEAWLVKILYYVFLICTYVLALNALIALMSGTCSHLAEKKRVVWKSQLLSVILFLENLTFLPQCLRCAAGSGREKHDTHTWIDLKITERSSCEKATKRMKSTQTRKSLMCHTKTSPS